MIPPLAAAILVAERSVLAAWKNPRGGGGGLVKTRVKLHREHTHWFSVMKTQAANLV